MLDYTTDQADLQSPLMGPAPRVTPPTALEAFSAAKEANDRLDGMQAAYRNQQDFLQQRMDTFTSKTGVALPKFETTAAPGDDFEDYDGAYRSYLGSIRSTMQTEAKKRNDPTLLPPSDDDIAAGGLQLARGAAQREANLRSGPGGAGMMLGNLGASLYGSVTDPYNAISAAALTLAPEGAPLLAAALRTAGAMGAQQLVADVARYGYRRQVDPTYGPESVAGDVAEAAVGGALFGAGHALGGEGVRGALGAAAGGAVGGAAFGGLQDGPSGALEGAAGGAALPLLGASVATIKQLGASWRAMVAARPELAASMPLEVRDAGAVAEKAGDLDAQNPYSGTSGAAAHGEAVAKVEDDLLNGRAPELPPAAQAEAQVRRGQVFFPGGAIEARYGVAEHGDLITSHDADFNVRPDYPLEMQPRDRASAPARDQVTNMAGNLAPERLGPSVEANSGAPIVGPDGVVESGNGRTIAIGQAYDMGRGDAYRQWLEGQGYDTTGFDKPILVGMRETPLDDAGRAAFAHAANGSAALRMSATEQALSDARLIDGPTLDLHAAPDLAAAANRDFARAVVAKLPQGERGGMLTRDGGLSAGGVARVRNALTARAYGDPGFLARALDHPDPNIKAIAGALGDAAGPWARMRDAATAGDIEAGHDITRDVLQAVHAVMRARDEGRPAWEVMNQGDMFQSDTTQLAARMFFRDEAMRQPAGRARVAEALTSYAEEAARNTKAGRLFADDVGVGDVLRRVVSKVMPGASDDFVLASIRKIEGRDDWLGGMMRDLIAEAEERPAPPRMEQSLEDALRELIGKAPEKPPLPAAVASGTGTHTIFKPGDVTIGDEPEGAFHSSDGYEGEAFDHSMSFVKNGDAIDAVIHDIRDKDGNELDRPLSRVEEYKLKRDARGYLEDQAEEETAGARWDSLTPTEQQAELDAEERERLAAANAKADDINSKVDALVATGWRPRVNSHGGWRRPDAIKPFASPQSEAMIQARLRYHGIDVDAARLRARETGEDALASIRRTPEELAAATDQAAQDVAARLRTPDEGTRPQGADKTAETQGKSDEGTQPDLTLRNGRTGAEVQAQEVAPLRDMLKRFDSSRDAAADPIARATRMVVGDRLSKIVGDMKVFTVGPDEMRALTASRMNLAAGFEAAGFYDRAGGHIVVLDDVARNPAEMSQLLVHEGLHGAFMETIEGSPAAENVIDHLRQMAMASHFERGGDATDHYGLTNAHEFVSEAFSNPEFQRFLASIPADDRTVQAFGLDKAPGNSLWDVFVAAVRKILGLAPDQHTLLDATMRVGKLLDEMRAERIKSEAEAAHIGGLPGRVSDAVDGGAAQASIRDAARDGGEGAGRSSASEARGAGGDGRSDGGDGRAGTATAAASADTGDVRAADRIAPAVRLVDPDERRAAAQEAARKARAFSDAKAAIAYRINSDRIAQHPNGPLAGFLGLLTRDIRDARPSEGATRNNVESVGKYYEGRFAGAMEKILEPYGSKWAGLKQDVAGFRDVIRENFGVDTGNATAKIASQAWREGVDKVAVAEAKRLGKVFTAAEDWRQPQWWESRRAQKFGKARLLSDMRAEIATGGLKVYDPATGEEANPIRREAILADAADKISTDASLGGTHGGAFKNDMRVFRFADGEAGAAAYLRLMDKYGPGRGGYVQMMQSHVAKVSRELGLLHVLGPSYMETGERLLQDTLRAHAVIEARDGPRDLAQRSADLPGDAGKVAIGWLESPAKAEAVWQHMSGQASGVGSELMAGLLSGTRDFMTATRMGSALITAVPADTVNALMAAQHNGLPMGRMVSEVAKAFAADTPERREEAAGLGIAVHAGIDAAIGTKRFQDEFLGSNLMRRLTNFVIRGQGLHPWDAALQRTFPVEFLRGIGQRAGKSFDELDAPFARFLEKYGLDKNWDQLARPENVLPVGEANYLHPDKLDEPTRVKLMSAIYDERQFAYLAGGSERVRAISAQSKAGTLPGEAARTIMQFKTFSASILATWGLRAAAEAASRRFGTLGSLLLGMTCAGALSIQARAMLQGKDPQTMNDPWFWGEAFLQGGALGIYGDFFKEAFSRSDTSLTETLIGPLAAIPTSIQGLTSGARRAAEDGQHVNFGSKLSRIIADNVPGSKIWYARLLLQRAIFDNIQRTIDPDYARAFARQQQRAQQTYHQGFYWSPGDGGPSRAPDLGAALQ